VGVAANFAHINWCPFFLILKVGNCVSPTTAFPVVTRIGTEFPVRPNGITINYFAIEGGALDTPRLIEGDMSEDGAGEYSMVVSQFQVGYNVLDCGYGMDLLIGSYESDSDIAVERVSGGDLSTSGSNVWFSLLQVQAASRTVGGVFHVSIGENSLRDVNANVTAGDLQELLNLAFSGEQGVSHSLLQSCSVIG
jgi:hypothetical protein